MLKDQLKATALKYFTVPEQYELFIEDFEHNKATFMWKEKDSDEGYYVELDANGKLISLSQPAKQNNVRISVEEQERIAKQFLKAEYEEALDYLTLSTVKENENGNRFKFEQFVGDYPLAAFYCFMSISHYGEILDFNFRGYTTNPPTLPDTITPKEKILHKLFEADWELNMQYLSSEYYSVPTSGLYVIYESSIVHHTFEANKEVLPVECEYYESKEIFAPFPNVASQSLKTAIESIIGIPHSMEIVRRSESDDNLQQIVWREKDWQVPDDKSMESFILSRFEESVKAEINTSKNQLKGFAWFKERKGNLDLTFEECRQVAAQFIATYFEEYVPYLLVKIEEPSFNNLHRATFILPISVDGYRMDGEFFMVCLNKTTGYIDMLMTPDLDISVIKSYTPPPIIDLSIAKQTLNDVDAFLQWEENYLKMKQYLKHSKNLMNLKLSEP